MIFRKVYFLLLIIFISFHASLNGQIYKQNSSIHNFFKDNFDSTIIYYSWSSWYPYPNYYIMTKNDSSLYYFTYESPYSPIIGRSYPIALLNKFIREQFLFQGTSPDTNQYFLPFYLKYADKKMYWTQVKEI